MFLKKAIAIHFRARLRHSFTGNNGQFFSFGYAKDKFKLGDVTSVDNVKDRINYINNDCLVLKLQTVR